MNKEAKWALGILACLVIGCLCLSVFCVVAGGVSYFLFNPVSTVQNSFVITMESTVVIPRSTPTPTRSSTGRVPATPTAAATPGPASEGAYANLQRLQEVIVPLNDAHDLAFRLKGKTNIPETVDGPGQPLQVGAQERFWAINDDTRKQFQIDATLRYVTDHLYFFIEDGVDFDRGDLERLCETFESKIYPTVREFFGSEWTPGVDNDPHLYVLYAGGLGGNIAGYYSPMDELHPEVNQYSNAHEMFFISSDNVSLGDEFIYGTMAHEFQHMIHWYRDRNETSWINEGFSVLAELLTGYDIGGFDFAYAMNPDIQLTYWPSSSDSVPHYGQSFLFLAYFLDRFGEDATKALVYHEENSMEGIDAVMQELNITDPLSGKLITANDIFADWAITSYLNDDQVGDGRFAYQLYQNAPRARSTTRVNRCPADWQPYQVHQFGVDYIEINCSGQFTLDFQGDSLVSVLPTGPYEGQYAFWSNRGDTSNMTLTQLFDFSSTSGPLTLKYRTWYDLEEDYDYVYLVASEDGQRWDILDTPSGTGENPSGNSYGWGYNASSDGWIEEKVDISQFAGKKVYLRFEYITDTAVNGEGFLLDAVEIPEINYRTGFETDDGGWDGQGFVRIENDLPQTYLVSLIIKGRETRVQYLELNDHQQGSIPVTLGANESAVLVVSGSTRFTNQRAPYRIRFGR